QPLALLGRPRRQPVEPGAGASREPRRARRQPAPVRAPDRRALRRRVRGRVRAAARPLGSARDRRTGGGPRGAGELGVLDPGAAGGRDARVRERGQGDRRLRAPADARRVALRPLRRGRAGRRRRGREGDPQRRRGGRPAALHRRGRLHELPRRAAVHEQRVPQHRGAGTPRAAGGPGARGRRQAGPRERVQLPGPLERRRAARLRRAEVPQGRGSRAGARLQAAHAAQRRGVGPVHARRPVRDARRGAEALRRGPAGARRPQRALPARPVGRAARPARGVPAQPVGATGRAREVPAGAGGGRPVTAALRATAPWAVLRHRDYRLVWLGQAVSGVGTFMQVVSQSLLVLELSGGSPVALGTVSLTQAVAFVAFSLIGGSVVDRFPKRRVLFVTQSLLMGLAATLAVLTAAGAATLPLVMALAFASGVVASFDQPARSSLLPHLVPRAELPRATALNALVMTAAGTLGPALAGLTAATLGLTVNFALNALGFAVVIACLASVRTDAPPAPAAGRQPLLRSVGAGLAVVGGHA